MSQISINHLKDTFFLKTGSTCVVGTLEEAVWGFVETFDETNEKISFKVEELGINKFNMNGSFLYNNTLQKDTMTLYLNDDFISGSGKCVFGKYNVEGIYKIHEDAIHVAFVKKYIDGDKLTKKVPTMNNKSLSEGQNRQIIEELVTRKMGLKKTNLWPEQLYIYDLRLCNPTHLSIKRHLSYYYDSEWTDEMDACLRGILENKLEPRVRKKRQMYTDNFKGNKTNTDSNKKLKTTKTIETKTVSVQTVLTKDYIGKSKKDIFLLNGLDINKWDADDIFYALTNYEGLCNILTSFELYNLAVTIRSRGILTMKHLKELKISDLHSMNQPIPKIDSIFYSIKQLCMPLLYKDQIMDIIKQDNIASFGMDEIAFFIRCYIELGFMTEKQKEYMINILFLNDIKRGEDMQNLDENRLNDMNLPFTKQLISIIKSFFFHYHL